MDVGPSAGCLEALPKPGLIAAGSHAFGVGSPPDYNFDAISLIHFENLVRELLQLEQSICLDTFIFLLFAASIAVSGCRFWLPFGMAKSPHGIIVLD